MRPKLKVVVPPLDGLIKVAPGFQKKRLAEHKIDLVALCEFGCAYCSSNAGNYLRINRERFADLTQEQLGERLYPTESPRLTMHFPSVVQQLERELARKPKSYGMGKTLVVSMLTDAFSPSLVKDGTTRSVLELLLRHTSFCLRILTKNAIVGSDSCCDFFAKFQDRVVVGLSTGTTDDEWATRVEKGTSKPSARLRSLRRLQDAGISTFGMLCPVFPSMLAGDQLERLIAGVRPELCDEVWAEPYNDRTNWRSVRDTFSVGSTEYLWFDEAFGDSASVAWSAYALDLYQRIRARAEVGGWLDRLRYLLYEHHVADEHVVGYGDLAGILLQSKPDHDGLSSHRGFAAVQRRSQD